MDKTGTVADALAAIKEAFTEFWAALDADTKLDADERAEVTSLADSASTDVDEASTIIRDADERE